MVPSIENPEYDVTLLGTGIAGFYMVQIIKGMGYSIRVFEAASETGSTS